MTTRGHRRGLTVPTVLSVVVLGCVPHHASRSDGKVADSASTADARKVADARIDGGACPVDSPPLDAKVGCLQPCGDISPPAGTCHGMEVCVDPCGECPPGCSPLV